MQFLYPYFSEEEILDYYNGEYRKLYSSKEYYTLEMNKVFFQRALPEAKTRYERVRAYLSKDDEVLEIGCASGYFLDVIKEHVFSVEGVELDEKNREYCKSIGIDTEKDIKDFHKKFDKIFIFHVLEHIKEPVSFLNNLKIHLKKGGKLFIEVPSLEDPLLSMYSIPEYRDFYYQMAHLWYFNNNSLSYILNKVGFEFTINNIQRYDLTNHLKWLNYRDSGSNNNYKDIFDDVVIEAYNDNLIRINKTDTIFAVCSLYD